MLRLTRIVAFLLALVIATPAIAHNRIDRLTPSIDLRSETAEHEQSLRVVPRDLFADVASVEMPRESIVDQLERRFRVRLSASAAPTLRIFTAVANEKLASGLLALRDQSNV